MSPKANRGEQIGWYFYDWATSPFMPPVATVFLGPYLTTVTKAAADPAGFVYPLGIKVYAGSFFPYVVSLSVLLQVVLLPVLGAISDYSHRKKQMLGLFAYVGGFATMGFYFLHGTNYLLGGVLFVVANLSFGASVVCYNAFLPDIADLEHRDSVSSMGWALGYVGGGLCLALNLLLFAPAEALGLTPPPPAPLALPGGVPLLQRRRPDGHQHVGPVRSGGAGPAAHHPDPDHPDGAVRGLLRRAALQRGGEGPRQQARHRRHPRDLDRHHRLRLRAAPDRDPVRRPGRRHRHRPRREPGAEPLGLLADDPERPGGRVLQRVRGERAGHELARPLPLRRGAAVDGQLPGGDPLGGGLLHHRP